MAYKLYYKTPFHTHMAEVHTHSSYTLMKLPIWNSCRRAKPANYWTTHSSPEPQRPAFWHVSSQWAQVSTKLLQKEAQFNIISKIWFVNYFLLHYSYLGYVFKSNLTAHFLGKKIVIRRKQDWKEGKAYENKAVQKVTRCSNVDQYNLFPIILSWHC